MVVITFPFKYYSVLPDYTLTTKIREDSWKLDKLFPLIKKSESELKRLGRSVKTKISDLPSLYSAVASLSKELMAGIKFLKYINFYDSALLYLYFRLLRHVHELCRHEHGRLAAELKELGAAERKLNKQKLRNFRRAKREIAGKIRKYRRAMRRFHIEESRLIHVSWILLKIFRSLRWKAEKQAQHEFYFSRFTLRGFENLSRKIKVEAIKVKRELIPRKNKLMGRIRQRVTPADVHELAKLASEAIDRIGKDASYSSKLISQFERELNKARAAVENLKNTLNKLVKRNKISSESAKKAIKPFESALEYVQKDVDNDLMQIFNNIFVGYKHVGKSMPKAA